MSYPASLTVALVSILLTPAAFARAGPDAAPRPEQVAFLGVWDRAAPLIERASRDTGVPATLLRVQDVLASQALPSVRTLEIVYVLNFNPDQAGPLKDVLGRARQANARLRVIPLDRRDGHAALRQAGFLLDDPAVVAYWRANGPQNMRRLLTYTWATYLGGPGEVEPPVRVPEVGYYAPESPEEALTDLAAFKSKTPWSPGAAVVVQLINQSFWVTQDTKVIDAQIAALRARGMNVVTLFSADDALLERMLLEAKPDLLVEDRHGTTWADRGGAKTLLEELDVPYLRPISMLGYTVDEWLNDPRGLHGRDLGAFMSLQESRGTIEPIVVGGLKASISGYRLHEPIQERVDRFAARAASWVNLRRKPNGEKKLAIVYYNKSLGKDDLMRGSPSGAFLDGPESLVRFLPKLRERGYDPGRVPATAAELLGVVRERGRNIGPWAQGELDVLADKPGTVLVPLETYRRWFEAKLSDANRQAVVKHHGDAPGRLMVVTRNGKPFIVIPAIRTGNVLLAAQPERGEKQDERLLHSGDVPPPHNYLAFYWWLQEEYGADAVLHWGTHGSLELLPGKENGLCQDDWSDVCVGTMPVVDLWVMDNIGESTLARRRSYALLVDHLVPPTTAQGLGDELRSLDGDIDKFYGLQPGQVREAFRNQITEAVHAQRLDETLKIEPAAPASLSDEQIKAVHDHLHVLLESRTPTNLHVLGQNPDVSLLPAYLVSVLRKPFRDRVASLFPSTDARAHPGVWTPELMAHAERIVAECVLGDAAPPEALSRDVAFARDVLSRLNGAGDEVTNLLRALDGRYVAPGPGPDPIRNPSSVPSGRNLYALNPEEIPTRASWDVAVKLVHEMLKTRRPRKVGMDLSGMSTMQDLGVMEAQILYLMGVRPVWDHNNLAVDVELIPRAELRRPRVDVFIAMGGHYKENFASRVKLLDKAVRLVSALDEEENLVRQGSVALEAGLVQKGFSLSRARQLSSARIFGTKPGNLSGSNILYLVPRSGVWEADEQIASVYVDNMSFAYTGELWGEKVDGLYEQAIQGTDTLVRVWASNMTSQLSNHHAYEYLGGMSMAVKKLTGREPEALIADVRDPEGARMRQFEEVLDTTFRTELLNPKWIAGMKQHDYAGAGHVAELVKNTFGWSVTRRSAVSDGVWNEVYETYVKDSRGLVLHEWFERVNPHAIQEVAATLLEASRKGYWSASGDQLATLGELYASSVVKHGPSAGLVSGGNVPLEQFVARQLAAPGRQPLAAAFAASVASAAAAPGSGGTKVYGPKLEPATRQSAVADAGPAAPQPTPGRASRAALLDWWPALAAAGALAAFLVGLLRRTGGAR